MSVAVIAERLWALSSSSRRSERFHRAALEAWQEGGVSEVVAVTRRDDSILGSVYRGVLSLTESDDDTRLHVAARQVTAATRTLKRYIWLLGTIGSLAPFYFSFMGGLRDHGKIENQLATAIANDLKQAEVDLALLVPY